MKLVFLKPEEVAAVWDEIAPQFERVVKKACHGEFTVDGLYRMALAGNMVVGVAREEDGSVAMVMAFQFVRYPAATGVSVLAMAGKNLKQFMGQFLPPFREFCRQAGADWIECAVSPGMERMHHRHGFETVYRNLRMSVKEDHPDDTEEAG